jgi:hypothetical protein
MFETWLDRELLAPYPVPLGADRSNAFEDFREQLPPGRGREEVTARVLFEEFNYLRARGVVLTDYWWPFDALVEAGSIAMWVPQRDLPPKVTATLRRWRIKGSVRYAAIGIGRDAHETIVPPVHASFPSVTGGIFLGMYTSRAL